jgi:anti-sigma regulatory factor (Ser/Thr protein kinase)
MLIVGTDRGDLDTQIRKLAGCETVSVPDANAAVASLRLLGHNIPAALLNISVIEEDLEELVVYFHSTFPEVILASLGDLPDNECRRLKCLGISHCLTHPLTAQSLKLLLKRPTPIVTRTQSNKDWVVTVDRGDWVEISVPSQSEYVSRIQDLLDLLERSKLDQDTRDELMLAIDELVTNAMEWGNHYNVNRQVRVSYYCMADRIMLKIEDVGEGFNTTGLVNPTEDLKMHIEKREAEGKRPGGFGVHMIRNLMDDFSYNDRGNIVLLTKFLA